MHRNWSEIQEKSMHFFPCYHGNRWKIQSLFNTQGIDFRYPSEIKGSLFHSCVCYRDNRIEHIQELFDFFRRNIVPSSVVMRAKSIEIPPCFMCVHVTRLIRNLENQRVSPFQASWKVGKTTILNMFMYPMYLNDLWLWFSCWPTFKCTQMTFWSTFSI